MTSWNDEENAYTTPDVVSQWTVFTATARTP